MFNIYPIFQLHPHILPYSVFWQYVYNVLYHSNSAYFSIYVDTFAHLPIISPGYNGLVATTILLLPVLSGLPGLRCSPG
jgi:hypothetical protein